MKINQNPGPGSYQAKNYIGASPSFTLPKTQRFIYKPNIQLGPGYYTLHPPKPVGVLIQHAKRPQLINTNNQNPGPGRYRSNSTFSGPSYSISPPLSPKTLPQQEIGPGYYETPIKKKVKCLKFSQNRRNSMNDQVKLGPGPQKYNIRSSLSNRGTVIGSEARVFNYQTSPPGPGTYNAKIQNRQKGCIMRKQDQQEYFWMSPGPGDYENVYRKTNQRIISFGRQKRFKEQNKCSPGPGEYQTTKKRGRVVFFGSQERVKSFSNVNPGPGTYRVEQTKVWVKSKVKKVQIKEGQKVIEKGEKVEGPGPGSYSPQIKGNTSVRFGKERRIPWVFSSLPGPGKYDLGAPMGKTPKYSLTGQRKAILY